VSDLSGDGLLDLNFAAAQDIQDAAGSAFVPGTGITSEQTYTIDNTSPATPAVTAIATDSGVSAADGITNDPTLVISGSAEANSTVTVFKDGVSIGTATAIGSGAWSFNHTGTTLSQGVYSFTAAAVDAAGNVSAVSAAFQVVVDTTAPVSPITFPTATSYTAATWTGSIAGTASDTDGASVAQVQISIRRDSDGQYWSGTAFSAGTTETFLGATGTTSWSYPLAASNLTDGVSYTVRAKATDTAANAPSSPTAVTFTYNATHTVTVYYVNDSDLTNDAWATAVGNDANDGLTPATPKATVQAILAAYDLGPGDVVRIDTGSYLLTTITADDGGSDTVTVSVDIDMTAPAVTLAGITAAPYLEDPRRTARCVGSDALSGIASCVVNAFELGGGKVRVEALATDKAGLQSVDEAVVRMTTSGILRATYSRGAYEVERGKKYTVVVLGIKKIFLVGVGDVTRKPKAFTSKNGRWELRFKIPAGTPLGKTSLLLRKGKGATFRLPIAVRR